jgi:nucleotide-binding universal stress UspA family protein
VSYKDILVFLDDGRSNDVRVKTAIHLAKTHGAMLTGVALEAMKPEHLIVQDEDAALMQTKQFAQELLHGFLETAENEGVEEVDTILIPGKLGESARTMAQIARNYDLVMLRQPNPDKENYARLKEFAEVVMMHCGRPVFFMPYIGAHRIPCKKSMIAWDGSPSSTRAVHNAIPMISKSKEVTVLVVASKKTSHEDMMVDQLIEHLARYDINATSSYIDPGTFDIQTTILNEVADNDIDILIMGGYGTPSIRQKIFGGVTHSILASMIVPILMSH